MDTKLLLQELTREEAKAIAPEALIILPVGAIEQHGPHLPVGTDAFAVEHIARAAATIAKEKVPTVVAPTLPFGSSHHHLPFGGTMSFSSETYFRIIRELAESLIIGGFQRIFILNGHGGNNELIQQVARDLPLSYPVHMAAASYWTIAWDALIKANAHVLGRLPGHAGAFETSLVMTLQPDLICEPRPHRDEDESADPRSFYPAYRTAHPDTWQRIDGYSDSPDRGTAEQGEAYLAAIVQAVVDAFIEFYTQCG